MKNFKAHITAKLHSFVCRLSLACLISTPLLFSNSKIAFANPENDLLQALDAIQASEIPKAEQLLKTLIDDEPEFKLAHMVYADLLKARAMPLSQVGMGMNSQDKRNELLKEVKVRYQANQDFINTDNKIPRALNKLSTKQKHAIVIDLNQSRLYLFENNNGQPKRIMDYYISMGRGGGEKKKEGDLKTPLGVYFVKSFIPDSNLSDKYGAGAYPINYPNELDTYNGLTGSGIWLHGTRSGTYNRAPLASEGCVVLPNDDLKELSSYITLGQTPVIIGNSLTWLNKDQWQVNNDMSSKIFNQWVSHWESLNTDTYLSHYSEDFDNGKKNYDTWVKHKKRIAKNKKFIQVETSNLSLLKHPNKDIMVATFLQSYNSSNYSNQSWKRQYWKKERDGEWRIIYEASIKQPIDTKIARR